MPSPVLTPTASPRRRALHERTQSQTNERSPSPIIGLVNNNNDEREEINFYSATPYPTKPTQVLLPNPGKGQGSYQERDFGVSDVSLSSAETSHTATGHVEKTRDVYSGMNNTWELSSSVDIGNSSSQVWQDDPKSSRSSFPDPSAAHEDDAYDNKTVSGLSLINPEGPEEEDTFDDIDAEEDETDEEDEDDVIVLPTVRATVKAVPPETPPPKAGPSPYDSPSSPNVVPIGLPSSPNFVPLDSSSPNLIPLGSSSPNVVTEKRSDSSIASTSSNSLGTVIRTYNTAADWSGPSSDVANSHPASIRSSPPEEILRSYQSTSSLALPPVVTSRSRSETNSTSSSLSAADVQTVVDSGALVQYPTIRAASSGSYAESSIQRPGLKRPTTAMTTDQSSERYNPRLSTIPSQWSEERQLSVPSPSASDSLSNHGKPSTGRSRSKTASTIWIVDESSGDEHLDSLSNLPQSQLRHIPSTFPGSHSSTSRSNSLRSLRPGSSSSSSVILNTLPNWVRLYYSANGRTTQNPAMSFFDSRPSTASRPTSPARYLSHVPSTIARPRSRPLESPPRLITDHPADPRSHWRHGQREEMIPGDRISSGRLLNSWSPHLHPDKGHQDPRNTWVAPSMNSAAEPLFGRRNVQIYSFCLGFVFPLAWLIAAFLPLPRQPISDEEAIVAGPGIATRIREFEVTRYQNARWWRNLNRVMIPVGVVIIAIIVTLAVVGTTMGFH